MKFLLNFICYAAGFLVLSLLLSCRVVDSNNDVWVYYDEVKCEDKWEYAADSSQIAANVMNYAESNSLVVLDFRITRIPGTDLATPCEECDCKSFRRFELRIKQGDKQKAEAIGFEAL